MRFRAVSLDLFDTLVDLFMERLPQVEVLGHTIRATTGDLHAALAGRLAFGAGRMPRKLYATASSPEAGVIG